MHFLDDVAISRFERREIASVGIKIRFLLHNDTFCLYEIQFYKAQVFHQHIYCTKLSRARLNTAIPL
jgi:hypothetical protein